MTGSTWYVQHRQQWIADMLRVFGFVNRGHLMRQFGISEPQASKDLQLYQRQNPGAVSYNVHAKRYESAQGRRQS